MRNNTEELENVQRILQLILGWSDSDVSKLALHVRDLVWSDRQIIKILGRNIESLTMQMKQITQVTFERDAYKEGIETYKEIAENLRLERNALRERLSKYE